MESIDALTRGERLFHSLWRDQVDPDVGLTPGLPRGRSLVLVRALGPWGRRPNLFYSLYLIWVNIYDGHH
jgi:hypothetical protein